MVNKNGMDNILYWLMKLHVDGFIEIENQGTRNAILDLLNDQNVKWEIYGDKILIDKG